MADEQKTTRSARFRQRTFRGLRIETGTPLIKEAMARVVIHWDIWYTMSAKKDPEQTPSVKNMIRFLNTVMRWTKINLPDKEVPSLITIKKALFCLIVILQHRHKDLWVMYDKQTRSLMRSFLSKIVDDKRVIKGVWRPRQRFGFQVIHHVIEEWLRAALIHGTSCWDRTLVYALGIVLQCACAARVGEIAVPRG